MKIFSPPSEKKLARRTKEPSARKEEGEERLRCSGASIGSVVALPPSAGVSG